ncbi:uncharacterized protein BX663DRAFT_442409, partial [Cokeromyces recurvatus]|uniref:uncharacterized protein n=1 Tax=Cokeromyces recurvatus TaxID=90255 RepID=UPI00221F408B
GGAFERCVYHIYIHLSRLYVTECLHMHTRSHLPRTIGDSLSFLSNCLLQLEPRGSQNVAA